MIFRKLALALVLGAVVAALVPATSSATLAPVDPTNKLAKATANSKTAVFTGDSYTAVCDTASMTVSYATGGVGLVSALSFTNCTTALGIGCTLTVDNLTLGDSITAGFTVVHTGSGVGSLTLGGAATITVNSTCVGITCTYNMDTTNLGTFDSGDPANLTFITGVTTTSGGDCTNGKLKATYTFDVVDAYTGTPTPDDTKLTLS